MTAMRVEDEYDTIEQDWPRLFKEYPEVYYGFAESEWVDPNTFSVNGRASRVPREFLDTSRMPASLLCGVRSSDHGQLAGQSG